ncbi:Arrestin domain-containing protein 2, partial [Trichinella pseudospiralis]
LTLFVACYVSSLSKAHQYTHHLCDNNNNNTNNMDGVKGADVGGGGGGGSDAAAAASAQFNKFDIQFDREPAMYFPEDDVDGSVKVSLNQPLRLANLRLVFRGRARFDNIPSNSISMSYWRTAAGDSVQHGGPKNSGEMVYFDKEVVLVDRLPGKEDAGEFVLPNGEHTIPFTFPLPKRLLNSFEGKYGSIRYYCQAIISRTGRQNYVTERPFTVLNRDPSTKLNLACTELLKPAVHEDSEKVSNCCTSGIISCELYLPKRLYVAGETVSASLQIVNASRKPLSKICARLIQQETFYSTKSTDPNAKLGCASRCVVTNEMDKQMSGRSKKSFPNEVLFHIPAVPASSDTCPIMHISYELELQLIFSGRSNQVLLVQAPIEIASPFEIQAVGDCNNDSTDCKDGGAMNSNSCKALLPTTKSIKYVQCAFGLSSFELAANPSPMNRIEYAPFYPVLSM